MVVRSYYSSCPRSFFIYPCFHLPPLQTRSLCFLARRCLCLFKSQTNDDLSPNTCGQSLCCRLHQPLLPTLCGHHSLVGCINEGFTRVRYCTTANHVPWWPAGACCCKLTKCFRHSPVVPSGCCSPILRVSHFFPLATESSTLSYGECCQFLGTCSSKV